MEGEDDGATAGGGMGHGQEVRAHDGARAGDAGARRGIAACAPCSAGRRCRCCARTMRCSASSHWGFTKAQCDEAAKTQIHGHTAITVLANRCVSSTPTSKGRQPSVCSKGPDASVELHRSSQKAVSKASRDARSKGFAYARCDSLHDQIPPFDSPGAP